MVTGKQEYSKALTQSPWPYTGHMEGTAATPRAGLDVAFMYEHF